ncbi:MAG: rhomboid family intramembrane serine protease [Chthoniobacterales bacterium]|nr:rhomboid family intramembrane serine protease [Chthoniobacterales bacterium]
MRLSGRKPSSFTRSWAQRQRVVLLTLIGVNVCAFLLQLVLESYQPEFVRAYLGLSKNGLLSAYAWQFFTAPFLHDGAWHLLANTIVLYLLGRDVESILGQRHFFFLCAAGAIAGELGHLFMMPGATVLLAASGGVAAVLMAYATILPELELTAMLSVVVPLRIKAKHLACGAVAISAILLLADRSGTVSHSAYLGGCAAGWLYAHLLGFGRPSFLQRALHQRKTETERYQQMNAEQFIAEKVDPLLEKISRKGLRSLSRSERRTLVRAREKLVELA